MNETHDAGLRSWIESANAPTADFPIQNLPFGVFRRSGTADRPRIGVAIGDEIVDLARCRERGRLAGLPEPLQDACSAPILNPLMALGPMQSALRRRLVELLRIGGPSAPDLLVGMPEAEMLIPIDARGFTDFYASVFHATNVGSLFRPDNPLLPNYKHVPIAYHGRASSLVVSGTPVRRPWGQIKAPNDRAPSFRPSQRIDYETEVAAIVGTGNELGTPIDIDWAEEHLFGLCLLNDWSARDIQSWEYQPLGPFLAKNFATTMSAWIVTIDALAPFRCAGFTRPDTDPQPLPYLTPTTNGATVGFDITIDVFLRSARMRAENLPALRLSRGSFADMYWSVAQMVTHHASGGCNLQTGDVIASGTVSGASDDSRGCLLEITGGSRPLELPSGEQRLFLADGDEVTFHAFCERRGPVRIGFGVCSGVIAAAHEGRDRAASGDLPPG
jgi:fumarylacetoacetase